MYRTATPTVNCDLTWRLTVATAPSLCAMLCLLWHDQKSCQTADSKSRTGTPADTRRPNIRKLLAYATCSHVVKLVPTSQLQGQTDSRVHNVHHAYTSGFTLHTRQCKHHTMLVAKSFVSQPKPCLRFNDLQRYSGDQLLTDMPRGRYPS